MNNKKRSLLASGLCLGLSAALLTGATFAWFTDSVTNKGNTIQAGNLEVSFLYRDLMSEESYKNSVPEDESDAGALFTDGQIWEPGYSYGYDFRVKNVSSSLAFNYQLEVSNIQVSGNDQADVAQVLKVYATSNDQATSLKEYNYVGTLADLREGRVVYTSTKDMQKGWEDDFSVVIQMDPNAGNMYQNCGVTFDLNLVAKQATHETDGFGNSEYDADAVYAQTTVEATGTAQANGAALQAAIDNAKPGSTIFVEAGNYDVTSQGTDTPSDDHNLLITNDNVTIVGEQGTVISSKYTSGMGDAQQTIMIKGDNVTLKNLTINPVEGYNNKTVEIMGAKNTVIENCTIDGNLYIGAPETGAYTVKNNTFINDDVSIVVANGAGTAMASGEKAVISGNTCSGALYLTGTRNTGWDNYELTNLPQITGNTFGAAKQTVNGTEYTHYIRVASTVKENLDKISVEDILSNNTFTGADNVTATDVQDNGTFYRFYN